MPTWCVDYNILHEVLTDRIIERSDKQRPIFKELLQEYSYTNVSSTLQNMLRFKQHQNALPAPDLDPTPGRLNKNAHLFKIIICKHT